MAGGTGFSQTQRRPQRPGATTIALALEDARDTKLQAAGDSPIHTNRVGDTVEWTIGDTNTPHTITFGTEPEDVVNPPANVTVDSDGARHAIINSVSNNVHSGFIQTAPQDRIGLAQAPLGTTRFRVTFTKSDVYHYECALHDGLGMKGTVVVLP